MLRPSIFNHNYVDNFFDDFFRDPFMSTGIREVNSMSTDIKETDQGYEMEMELPGFTKEDINAELKNGYMTIRATHSEEKEDSKDKKYIRKERYSGHYERSFYVGEEVKQEDIKAKFKDGVLTVEVPKKQAQPELDASKVIAIEGE